MISHVVAYGLKREIGKDNTLVWHLPDDLKHFKAVTTGGTVVMGRKTYESIGKALPNRRNIVVTTDRSFEAKGVDVWHDLTRLEQLQEDEEIFIIGGATLFEQTLPYTDRLYVTEVDGVFEADTYYPEVAGDWVVVTESFHPKDDKHDYSFTIRQYDKAGID